MRATTIKLMMGFALGAAVLTAQQDDEGPGRGVARISLLNGDVSVKRGDTGDLVAAALNVALMTDDRVITGASSRAEGQGQSTRE